MNRCPKTFFHRCTYFWPDSQPTETKSCCIHPSISTARWLKTFWTSHTLNMNLFLSLHNQKKSTSGGTREKKQKYKICKNYKHTNIRAVHSFGLHRKSTNAIMSKCLNIVALSKSVKYIRKRRNHCAAADEHGSFLAVLKCGCCCACIKMNPVSKVKQ